MWCSLCSLLGLIVLLWNRKLRCWLTHLAQMLKSLCYRELTIACRAYHWHHHCLWTCTLMVIKVSYLVHICINIFQMIALLCVATAFLVKASHKKIMFTFCTFLIHMQCVFWDAWHNNLIVLAVFTCLVYLSKFQMGSGPMDQCHIYLPKMPNELRSPWTYVISICQKCQMSSGPHGRMFLD